MNAWHDVGRERITPGRFIAYIEISKGSKNKYELDKRSGLLILDRILYTSTHYPQNYGFIPHTLSKDGDPLDVLVLCSEAIVPGSLVECTPIGILNMVDNGKDDEKIIAVPVNDPFYNNLLDIEDVPTHVKDEIRHFFQVYKTLEGKPTAVHTISGVIFAKEVIRDSLDAYDEKFGK